jgi:hydroxymethylglutaryl-CoA lyase
MGIKTGVNLDSLVETGEWISTTLNRRNESRAGAALYAKRNATAPKSEDASHTTTKVIDVHGPTSCEDIILSRSTSSATITLNNPRKGNVLNASMVQSLKSHMSTLSSDPTIQTIVLTNTGKYFCTGMDLSSSGPATTGTAKSQLQTLLSTFESLNSCPKTTIALVKGNCFGGGVGLAFCCDIRIVMGAHQKFILSEVKRGLVPATISKYVVREWGPALAREAMITGRPVLASELLARNIIHAVVDTDEEAQKKVQEYIIQLGTSAPRAVSQVKELVNAVSERKREAEEIERVFEDMMKPSDEAKFGIEEFRKGICDVDWGRWYREKFGKSKL